MEGVKFFKIGEWVKHKSDVHLPPMQIIKYSDDQYVICVLLSKWKKNKPDFPSEATRES